MARFLNDWQQRWRPTKYLEPFATRWGELVSPASRTDPARLGAAS